MWRANNLLCYITSFLTGRVSMAIKTQTSFYVVLTFIAYNWLQKEVRKTT